jgi:hypothetical protein
LKKYFKLVILSNVDNETFQASNRRLQVEFDAIYTAEDIGSYKPSARNFDYMIEKLGGIGVKPPPSTSDQRCTWLRLSSVHTLPVAGLALLLGVDRFVSEARASPI